MLLPGHSKNTKLAIIILIGAILLTIIYFAPRKAEGPRVASITQAGQYFIEEIETRVVSERGVEWRKLTPEIIMEVFPNVIEEDFNGAELKTDSNSNPESSKINSYLSPYGMATFLTNLSKRSGLPLDTVEGVNSIIGFMVLGKENRYGRIDINGEYTCLPKKNTGGAVTLECALGLKGDDGKYYGMNLTVLEIVFPDLKTGDRIRVEGSLIPLEESGSSNLDSYDIEGVIWVTMMNSL